MFLQKEFKYDWKSRHVYWDLMFKQKEKWITLTAYPYNSCFWKIMKQGKPSVSFEMVFDSLNDAKRYCEEYSENLCS